MGTLCCDLQDEELEAYLDFKRLAHAFRTWRTHAYLLKHTRCGGAPVRREAATQRMVALGGHGAIRWMLPLLAVRRQ